ncbi:MAG: DUF2231 domain-containing protein, partial [Nitrospiria bacterium]
MIEHLFPGLSAMQNTHPLFVHFPVAFFIGAALMEAVAVFYKERFHFVATWLLYMGVFAAVITVGSGFGAAAQVAAHDPLGHDSPAHHFIHTHRNWMLLSTLFGMGLAVYFLWVNQRDKWRSHRFGLFAGSLVLALLVSMGADRGGRLVFEFGTGVNPKIIKQPTEGEHND